MKHECAAPDTCPICRAKDADIAREKSRDGGPVGRFLTDAMSGNLPPQGAKMQRFGKNKYGACKTVCGQGHRHDSKAEAARCDYWEAERKAGRILHVDIQPRVSLPCGTYRPDFCVWQYGVGYVDGKVTVCLFEDVKGVVTAEFRRIRKTFDAVHAAAPLRVVALRGKHWEVR